MPTSSPLRSDAEVLSDLNAEEKGPSPRLGNGLSLQDLRVCLSSVTQAADTARFLANHVLSLCEGRLSASPYQRAMEEQQRLTEVRYKLMMEIQALTGDQQDDV